ncbi:MAG: hypothetical protein Q8873_06615 [Bacillota bacterium]|nr:hypothetical protein [Bacillota bacterium]
MNFINIYANLIRVALIGFSIYHIYKKQFKLIIATATVFILSFLLTFLEWAINIKLDVFGSFLYYTIILMSFYFGNALKYYDKYAWWDRLLHFICGILFVSFGIALAGKVAGLNKFNILFFSFTFSIALHGIWEITEYVLDCIMHTNHQRWQRIHNSQNHVPENAIQPAGLVDTMKDTIMCTISSLITCVVWWFLI